MTNNVGASAFKKSGAAIIKSLKAVEIIAIAILLFVVVVYSLSWAFGVITHSRTEEVVPDITKKSAMAALDLLAGHRLSLTKEGEEFDSSVPVGTVIRQLPPPGTVVRAGKAIRVWFSQGGESVFVPNLIGLPIRNAELLLRQGRLMLGEVSDTYSLSFDKGMVISQDPKSDANLSKNALVNVVVSAGAPPPGIVLMPDFRQKQLAEAEKWASDAAVNFTVIDDASSLFPYGTILGQSVQPDTVLSKDAKLELTVSRRKDSGAPDGKFHKIHYEMSQGGAQSQLRIVILDQMGEREIFNGLRAPGSKIDLAVPYGGPAKVRMFVNGILVEEKEMQ